ncbi:aminoacyl-tRNA hydrolase [Aestuariispira insulae]|uniref:Peptidyl-tRNA hydrolase n=1 Tax=Aestuariispira insulae TaxID=1461337 RepID=A0A3D9HXZ4_9PROT|nr:aminoacyl-tRNA hydrolase [Aestuariispira insulae]RED54290.1 peptidyl-tRNA hydrolase [Aestuariispira insulae]
MLLLVGLGNPGPKYEKNRHNVGFMAVDEIVRRHSFGPWKARFQALVAEGRIGTEKVLAIKPTTYMNESGRAVGEAMRFFKLEPADVTVIYDELDVAVGKIKTKQGGGHGGHNGLRSLDAHIGKDYWRVRIGIGHPGDKSKVHSHVLGDFSKAEWPTIENMIDAVSKAIPDLLVDGMSQFMSKIGLILKPPQNQKREKAAAEPDQVPATAKKPADKAGGAKDMSSAFAAAFAKAREKLDK